MVCKDAANKLIDADDAKDILSTFQQACTQAAGTPPADNPSKVQVSKLNAFIKLASIPGASEMLATVAELYSTQWIYNARKGKKTLQEYDAMLNAARKAVDRKKCLNRQELENLIRTLP